MMMATTTTTTTMILNIFSFDKDYFVTSGNSVNTFLAYNFYSKIKMRISVKPHQISLNFLIH